MFSEVSDMYVDIAQATEYRAAVEQHGETYGSKAEAHKVLEEEIIEVNAELFYMLHHLAEDDYDKIEAAARNCLKESAQVLAVLKKIKESKLT